MKAAARNSAASGRPTIILVHGAFVDGSGWAGVHGILLGRGFEVRIVQNPTLSLADDVAFTRRAIAAARGNVVLVGHSYGGVIITEAGSRPKVSALVYIAAFAPDQGESVASLNENAPAGAPALPILPPIDGFLSLDPEKFHAVFAADVTPDVTRFMADSQAPWSVQALEGKVLTPAWKLKPSWYLVCEDDRIIPPDAQHAHGWPRPRNDAFDTRKPCELRGQSEGSSLVDRGGRRCARSIRSSSTYVRRQHL